MPAFPDDQSGRGPAIRDPIFGRAATVAAATAVLLTGFAAGALPSAAPLAAAATCTSSVTAGIAPPAAVSGGIPGFHARWYGQSGYMTLCPGERSTATVAFFNSGSQGWVRGRMGEAAYLGTWGASGQDQPSVLGGTATGWPGANRIAVQPAAYVGPGQVSWFQFTVQAPTTAGVYNLGLRPLVEGAQWMEDYGVFWVVTVLNADGSAPRAAPGFVTRSGTQLTVNGQPYRFTGMNIYNANSRNNCWYTLGSGTALDASLNSIGSGQEVFRAWFFQSLATTNGQRDWAAFDHTLAVAAAHGQRVIATLADQWGACEQPGAGSVYKTEAWYQGGYRTTPMNPSVSRSYRDWAAEVATRYRNDPTILAWQLMNEAEDKVSYPDGACGSVTSLKNWADDVAAVVKTADRNHLVSLGTIGSGQCGSAGTDFQVLHAGGNIDLCEYHDYDHPADVMPGDQWNGLRARLDQCTALGKPLFIGESGLLPGATGGSLAQRASAFDAKVAAQLGAGAAGALLWAWNNGATAAVSGYDVGPSDPALPVLGKY